MKVLKIIIPIIVLLVVLTGCKKESSPVDTQNVSKTDSLSKSQKRGLAYNLTNAADLDTIKGGVSWWYNWGITTSAPSDYNTKYQMEFIPMLWGGNTSSTDITKAKNFIIAHPEVKYLLVMNEPNLTDQANRTPAQAAQDWLKYEQLANDLANQKISIALVGPAMNWGTMSGYSDPVAWLDAFYAEFKKVNGRDPRIDYLAFHWYDYGLAAQLDRLKKYGKKIWITEMANWNSQVNSYQKQMTQMIDMVNICETRTDVFRYAWFIGRGTLPDSKYTYLFNPTAGQLNDLGKLYISLPYTK